MKLTINNIFLGIMVLKTADGRWCLVMGHTIYHGYPTRDAAINALDNFGKVMTA